MVFLWIIINFSTVNKVRKNNNLRINTNIHNNNNFHNNNNNNNNYNNNNINGKSTDNIFKNNQKINDNYDLLLKEIDDSITNLSEVDTEDASTIDVNFEHDNATICNYNIVNDNDNDNNNNNNKDKREKEKRREKSIIDIFNDSETSSLLNIFKEEIMTTKNEDRNEYVENNELKIEMKRDDNNNNNNNKIYSRNSYRHHSTSSSSSSISSESKKFHFDFVDVKPKRYYYITNKK